MIYSPCRIATDGVEEEDELPEHDHETSPKRSAGLLGLLGSVRREKKV